MTNTTDLAAPANGLTRLPVARLALLVAAGAAVASTLWWSLSGIADGLFWDDVNDLLAIHDLLTTPLHWSHWGEELSNHPPTAFVPHLVMLEVFGRSGFAVAAHVFQSVMLLLLLVVFVRLAAREHGRSHALLGVGLVAAWPLVAADAREVSQDMWVAAVGLLALALAHGRRRNAAVAVFAVASLTKLTALGFLPAFLFLLRRRCGAGRSVLLMAAAIASIPFDWVVLSRIRGGPSRHFTYVKQHGYPAFVHVEIVNGVRHVLELFLYDGRWVLTLGAAAAAAVGWRRLRDTWSDLDAAMVLAVAGIFIAVTIFGGTDGLERYLVPLAAPLAWVVARMYLAAPARLGVPLAAAAIAVQLVAAWLPYSPVTAIDRHLWAHYIGLSDGPDATPAGVRDYVRTREHAIAALAGAQNERVAASWPISTYLSDPAAGFVDRPWRSIEVWKPGRPLRGVSLLMFDVMRPDILKPSLAWVRDPRIFGSRYYLVVGSPRPS